MSLHNMRPPKWSRLDNAAKIFPPISHGANTGVFRLSCELTEPADPALLQQALDETLLRYPYLKMVLRRGVFWHYLEQTNLRPLVEPEHEPPCAALYKGSRSLLLRVNYFGRMINLELFHVLADGSGAMAFFQALVTEYLALRHPEAGEISLPQASVGQRASDSFQKYYQPRSGSGALKQKRAFRLRGPHRPDDTLNVIDGVADVRSVLDAAHRRNVTLTIYLSAALACAIHEEMYLRDRRRPVVLTVPVDLRHYFPSNTARNFFGTIRVAYDFSTLDPTFDAVAAHTAKIFKEELTPERLGARMNQLAALEHNPFVRSIPLLIKNPALRLSGSISSLGETAGLSNIGKLHLPDALAPFVKGFGVYMSTNALQLCTCSFGSSLHMDFTSALESTEVQRRFFAFLVSDGVDVEIRSSEFSQEVSKPCSDAQAAV